MDTTDAPQLIEHVHKSLNYTPYDAKWIPCSARLVALGIHPKSKGALQVYAMQAGELKTVAEAETQHGLKCGTFGASSLEDRHIATGDFGGKLNTWDPERLDAGPVFSVQAHEQIVNAIDGVGGQQLGYGAPELVTGSRDGCVKVWDTRVSQPVLCIEPVEGQQARDCWAVTFGNSYNDEERVVVAGYDNGDVKMFDLRANAMRWESNVGNAVTCIEMDRKDIEMNKMVVTTLESKFRVYDLRTQHPEEGFAFMTERAHKSTVWLARHLPQNRDIFMTGGGNGGFNVYRYHYPNCRKTKAKDDHEKGVAGTVELLNSRVISSQPIVSMDWSPDREGLCTLTCLDQTLRVYIVTKLHKF